MELIKTVLSVPGNRERMIEKSKQIRADVIALDLEDSVPYQEKPRARDIVREWLPRLAGNESKIYVRINTIDGGLGLEDLEAVIMPGIDGISQPKPSTGRDIAEVDTILARLEREHDIDEGHIRILPWIETANGLINAYDIASASPRVVGVIFGANDLVLDTGMIRSEEGHELLYPRTKVVIAARAAGVLAIDTPFNDFKDEPGLINDADLARKLGFDGKFAIHPDQVETIASIFCPTEDEVAQATRILAAFEEATSKGYASASLDGKMIDIPIAQRALKIVLSSKNILYQRKQL